MDFFVCIVYVFAFLAYLFVQVYVSESYIFRVQGPLLQLLDEGVPDAGLLGIGSLPRVAEDGRLQCHHGVSVVRYGSLPRVGGASLSWASSELAVRARLGNENVQLILFHPCGVLGDGVARVSAARGRAEPHRRKLLQPQTHARKKFRGMLHTLHVKYGITTFLKL